MFSFLVFDFQVSAQLSWDYQTNMTVENQKAVSKQAVIRAPFARSTLKTAKEFNQNLQSSTNEPLKRIFRDLAAGSASDDDETTVETSKLRSKMEQIYATTEVCETNDKNKCYQLSPYLEELLHTEKDYDRLVWAWKGWYDNCGNQIRPLYLQYIDLLNEDARKNGHKDLSVSVLIDYDLENITVDLGIMDCRL